MKILFVASFFYPDSMGGSDRYIYEVARHLVQNEHSLTVITANPEGRLPAYEKIAGIKIYRYRVNNNSSVRYYLTSVFNCQKTIIRLLRDNTYDLVVLNHILPSLGAYLADNKIPKLYQFYAPYVLEFQDKINWEIKHSAGLTSLIKIPYMKIIAFFLKRIEKYLLWKSKNILALSEYSLEQIRTLYRTGEKVTIIPAGIDCERFKPLPDKKSLREKLSLAPTRPMLLTVRRLYHRMGLEELILAIKEVRQTRPDILLLIGGKGPLREKLQKLIILNNLQDNVRLLGFIEEKELVEYYNAVDYFILPTRELEGFGMVTLEALACGLPVLGTPVGATSQILGNLDEILLFEDNTASAMSKKVTYMLANYSEYPNLSQKCREYVLENFSWEGIIPKITEFYQKSVL